MNRPRIIQVLHRPKNRNGQEESQPPEEVAPIVEDDVSPDGIKTGALRTMQFFWWSVGVALVALGILGIWWFFHR